tara:strand:- start:172 stop:1173 length:1002 start_codon:yes stop_codon:yes gene_type:complete
MALASKKYLKALTQGSIELVWPANLQDSFDYLQINIAEFVPRARRSSPSISTPPPIATPTSTISTFATLLAGGTLDDVAGNILKNKDTILLPIPEDVSYTDNPQWNDSAIGVKGRFGPQFLQKSAEGLESGDTAGMGKALSDLAGAGKVSVILDLIRSKLGADPNAVTQNLNGKIANPYLEQVFGGIGMREFSFSWKLVPRNEKEQQAIHHIIKTLRKSSLPDLSGNFGGISDGLIKTNPATDEIIDNQGGGDRWLKLPKVFNLSWRSQGTEIESLPKIKTCVCKNVQVSYTPDNVWASHLVSKDNPYPIGYNLSLTFGETEIITGLDVEKGY